MAGVTCPHCGLGTAPAAEHASKLFNTSTSHQAKDAYPVYISSQFDAEDEVIPGYMVSRCQACDGRFVVEVVEVDYEGETSYESVWPLGGVLIPKEVPSKVRAAMIDAKQCHSVNANLGALLAARTAIIRLQRQLEISSLKELFESGMISQMLYEQSDQVRLWANDFAHDDLTDTTPNGKDLDELLQYLDMLLDVIYVQPAKLRRLQSKRRGRDKKR